MAAEKQEFTEHDLQGLKHFRSLRKLLVRLHGVGASRDKAGNRELFMDQYCVLLLVWLVTRNCAASRRRRGRRCAESGCLFSTQQRQLPASWKRAATEDST